MGVRDARAGGTTRRRVLSGTGLALLAGCQNLVPPADQPALVQREDDAAILNAALAVEYQAIAVYEVGVASALLRQPVLDLVARFRDDHAKHAEALVGTIGRLGATPARGEGAAGLPVAWSSELAFLRLAASVEKSAASIYLGAVPALAARDLAKAAAGIMGVETMHWAALLALMGENPAPLPFLG